LTLVALMGAAARAGPGYRRETLPQPGVIVLPPDHGLAGPRSTDLTGALSQLARTWTLPSPLT